MDKDEAKRALDIAEKKLSENDYVGARINGGIEDDWYGVLGVDSEADDETVRFSGAEGAFKLVLDLDAWSLLSDKGKKVLYDERRMQKKPPPSEQDTVSSNGNPSAHARSNKDGPVNSSNMFWSTCSECKTRCEYWRETYLNKTVLCPMCGKTYIATEQISRANGRQAGKSYNVWLGIYR